MKKLICMLICLSLCASLALPVLAEESSRFIPSYGLEVEEAVQDDQDVKECVVVTSVTEAEEKSTDIAQEERDLLVAVYDALSDGSMVLPVSGEYQFVELMDVCFALENCRQKDDHDQEEKDASLTVKFQLEIEAYEALMALVYIDEKWELVENLTDNGDGTVTITFDETCPVVILAHDGSAKYDMDLGAMAMDFVASITYKDSPAIEDATMDGEGVEDCLVVTSIKQAQEKSTDISQEDRDLLLEVYEKLEDGSMTLPLEGDYVIRDLVDLSFEYEDCRQIEEHGNKPENLAQEGVTLTVTFDMGVGAYEDVLVFAYVDGEWVRVEDVTNNGDGTITVIFEDICPVAFVIDGKESVQNPTTGDAAGNQLMLVMGMLVLSAAGIVALVVSKARKVR